MRLADLGGSPLNPFYDAAVRSMSHSWHNFFFGALEPGGSVSIDKPPVDLWLQVASVKALGFSTKDLLLPEALFGTAAVPLLFLAVRRIWSVPAGLAAALVLALLPIEVITSRSDTMDGVMMALTVLALLCVAQATQSGSSAWLLLGAAALGLAFDVKLTESLVALPGLVLFAALGLPGSRRRRAAQLLACAAVYVVVALAWLLGTLAYPAHERPFAVGSSNGSAWNAALVFNGVDRLEGKPTPGRARAPPIPPAPPRPRSTATSPRASANRRSRSGLHRRGACSTAPGPCRATNSACWYWPRCCSACRRSPASCASAAARERPSAGGTSPADERRRLWGLAGLVLWLVLGAALFSQMAHLHPALHREHHAGRGGDARDRPRLGLRPPHPAALGGARGLPDRAHDLPRAAAVRYPAGVVGRDLGRARGARGGRLRRATGRALRTRAGPASLLAVPAWASVRAIEHHTTDTNQLGLLPPAQLAALSSYLRSHQGSARYEAAYDSATKLGALVVHDQRPLVVLNSINAQVVTPLAAAAGAGGHRGRALRRPLGPLLAPLLPQQPRLLGGREVGRGPRRQRLRRRGPRARPHPVAAARCAFPGRAPRHGPPRG